ncbi:MAG: hypothetical protein AAF367_17680 [Pseudomonadota bacterium]
MKDLEESDPAMGGSAQQTVKHRRVFYISGFDPQGPRRYYQLYRDESQVQADISGYGIDVSPLTYERGASAAHWSAELREDHRVSTADIVMLRWDDIARSWMRMSLPATYKLMVKTWWRYVGSGAFWALTGIRAISTWVGMYPVAAMILYLLIAIWNGLFGVWAFAGISELPLWACSPVFIIVFYGLMRATRMVDDMTLVYYLMCDFGFTASHSEGEAPEIEARIDEFAARVLAEWSKDDCDEVLIVGHSSGGSYAASVAARVIEMGADKRKGPHLSFLTLGQTIPMLSFLPGAQRLRDELRLLGKAEEIDWIDVTSPADGGCYALSDPVGVSGVAPPMKERRNPKVISATFWEAVSPEMKAALKGRWFRIHIQYLCAFDRPVDFDYFRVTAGPIRLAERFAARGESPKLKGAPFIQHRLRDH